MGGSPLNGRPASSPSGRRDLMSLVAGRPPRRGSLDCVILGQLIARTVRSGALSFKLPVAGSAAIGNRFGRVDFLPFAGSDILSKN